MGDPQNGWFIIRETPMKIHDLGVPVFWETPIVDDRFLGENKTARFSTLRDQINWDKDTAEAQSGSTSGNHCDVS